MTRPAPRQTWESRDGSRQVEIIQTYGEPPDRVLIGGRRIREMTLRNLARRYRLVRPPIVNVVSAARYGYRNEDELQAGLTAALAAAGYLVAREVRLTGRDRVDLLVDRTALEVKVAGTADRVLAQLARYAASDLVDELVLVTTRARHRALPREVGGKPLRVVVLGGAGR